VGVNIRPWVLDLRIHGANDVIHDNYVGTRVENTINRVPHYLAQLSEDRRHDFIQLGYL
jgi:hypothetical protein